MSRISAAVLEVLEERAGGYCEACGRPLPADPNAYARHHRRAYGMGGRESDDPVQNTADNLLLLHHECHQTIHSRVAWSRLHGFIVRSWQLPVDVPVVPAPELARV